MMTTTVHTNISSTSVDGITALMMIMVDTGKPVCTSSCVGRRDEVGVWVTRAGYENGVDRESSMLLPNGVVLVVSERGVIRERG